MQLLPRGKIRGLRTLRQRYNLILCNEEVLEGTMLLLTYIYKRNRYWVAFTQLTAIYPTMRIFLFSRSLAAAFSTSNFWLSNSLLTSSVLNITISEGKISETNK